MSRIVKAKHAIHHNCEVMGVTKILAILNGAMIKKLCALLHQECDYLAVHVSDSVNVLYSE